MRADPILRIAGWSAYGSAVVAIVGIVFEMLFLALEASQTIETGGTNPTPLGTLNDATTVVQMLLMAPIALALYRLTLHGARRTSSVSMIVGIYAMAAIAALQALLVLGVASEQVSGVVIMASGLLGLWLLLANYLALLQPVLPHRLALFGILVGAGFLLLPFAFYGFGGASIVSDPASLLSNYPFLVGSGLGLLFGYICYPVWAIWLGRRLLSSAPA